MKLNFPISSSSFGFLHDDSYNNNQKKKKFEDDTWLLFFFLLVSLTFLFFLFCCCCCCCVSRVITLQTRTERDEHLVRHYSGWMGELARCHAIRTREEITRRKRRRWEDTDNCKQLPSSYHRHHFFRCNIINSRVCGVFGDEDEQGRRRREEFFPPTISQSIEIVHFLLLLELSTFLFAIRNTNKLTKQN